MEALFEIETIDTTIQSLEKALKEEQAIAEQLQKNAEAKAKVIADKLAVAKNEKRKLDLHKITEIVKNLHNEYGEDFVEVVKKEIKYKPKETAVTDLEKEDYKKYLHLFNRGYKGCEGKTYNHLGVEVKSNIPAQKSFKPHFSMATKKYAELYEKYN